MDIQIYLERGTYMKTCRKCKGNSIQYNTVVETPKTGLIKKSTYIIIALLILLLCFVFFPLGIVALIIFMINFSLRKKSKTVTYAVCQSCGHRWRVK